MNHPELVHGLELLPCAIRDGMLYIPHADGNWVSAAKLQPFSLKIIEYWRAEQVEASRSRAASEPGEVARLAGDFVEHSHPEFGSGYFCTPDVFAKIEGLASMATSPASEAQKQCEHGARSEAMCSICSRLAASPQAQVAADGQKADDDRFSCPECRHGWNAIDETERPRDECPNCGHSPMIDRLATPAASMADAAEVVALRDPRMEPFDRYGPLPGMIAAFEAHYGQSWTDKDWRDETSTWAAAWSRASAARPSPEASPNHDGETSAVHEPEPCPYCDGSGESTARSGGGPDAWDEPCTCPRCKGAQTLRAAYDTLAEELPALQLKVAQLGIFHSHATRYGWAPNQTDGMQSFRDLATQWLAATPGPRGENAGGVVEAWQLIETAPKDGTPVILGYISGHPSIEGHSEEGYWMDDATRNHWGRTGWFATSDDVLCDEPSNPDCWQPLPPAPDRGLRIAEKGDAS